MTKRNLNFDTTELVSLELFLKYTGDEDGILIPKNNVHLADARDLLYLNFAKATPEKLNRYCDIPGYLQPASYCSLIPKVLRTMLARFDRLQGTTFFYSFFSAARNDNSVSRLEELSEEQREFLIKISKVIRDIPPNNQDDNFKEPMEIFINAIYGSIDH